MPELYSPITGPTDCPECDTELVMLAYQGVKLGCPECTPDGLIKSYSIDRNAG